MRDAYTFVRNRRVLLRLERTKRRQLVVVCVVVAVYPREIHARQHYREAVNGWG